MEGLKRKIVLTRFHVFKIQNNSKKGSSFRGFTQLIEESAETEILSESTAPQAVATQPVTSKTTEVTEQEIDEKETRQTVEPKNDGDTLPIDRKPRGDEPQEISLDQVEEEILKTSHPERVIEPPSRKNKPSKPDLSKLSKTAPLGPLPSYIPGSSFGETAPLQAKDITGVAMEGDNFKPSQNVWTQQALVSYSENVVVSSPASDENPAILASPLKLRDQKTGVIELIDDNPNRIWSEEDRLLKQEISGII